MISPSRSRGVDAAEATGIQPDSGSSNARRPVGLAALPGWTAVVLFVLTGSAWALPSPDVLVNLFASAAQVLGLATVVFGRWFFTGGRRGLARGENPGWHRTGFLVSAGLCVVSLIGWGMFAARQSDLKTERLQVNIYRNSTEEGKAIADVSLKELSFSGQLKREDGVSTGDLAGMIERSELPLMLDIRETEETEMGAITGTTHVRFPDLMGDPDRFLDRARAPIYLLCANGNRSSELGSFLQERGFDCRFVIGGYEKWVAEDRPLVTTDGHVRTELREVPDFPNKGVLLDTSDVMALLEERPDILFVDVRYPGDFQTYGHLPDAVNLTIRKLTSPELDAALRALPKRPIIVPCYDRRSSFFGLIAGVRLSRMGYEFLGRYMTPESFWVPKADKEHVAGWKARHEPPSLLTVAAAPLEGTLGWLDQRIGSLALAVLALVLLIRIAIVPLTLKADRDRLAQIEAGPKLRELKARLGDDPDALARATSKVLKEHGIRPVFNLLGTVIQLLLFTLFFAVVDAAVEGSTRGFLWLPALGEPDPTRILPALVVVLLVAQILLAAPRVTKLRLAVAVAAGALLFALTVGLRSGTSLYLVANLSLLVLQTMLGNRFLRDRGRSSAAREAMRCAGAPVVPLRLAHLVPGCGGKASRLGALMAAGLPVPDGFVIRAPAIDARRASGAWAEGDRRRIRAEHARLRTDRVAVRSSGLNEDGANRSYAGVFESILDVGPDALFDAIENVAASLASDRARVYGDGAHQTGDVVVQAMVRAEYAGVLFTEHPGQAGTCAVELVAGLGDALVSGRVDPLTFRVGRVTARVLDGKQPPIDLTALIELGRRIEALFGKPQDIEWAWSRGRFFVLQARDITRLSHHGSDARAIRERERARLIDLARGARPDEIVYAQNELSELLPRPTCFSLAWMEEMWAYGGSAHLACRQAGIPYDVLPDSPPYVVGVFGSLYVNRREADRRVRGGPGMLASFRLSRAGESIEREFRDEFLPGFLREIRLREALDLPQLSLEELVDLFKDVSHAFQTRDYLQAETINVAADFYFKTAVRELEKRGLDPVAHLSCLPPTVVHEAIELLARVGRSEIGIAAFMELFGHRAPQDYELSHPRYREEPSIALAMATRSTAGDRAPADPPPLPSSRVLRLAVDRAKRFQVLKEEAKHHAMRELAFLRVLVLEIGRRLDVGDGVFWLTPDEVRSLVAPVSAGGLRKPQAVQRILFRQEEAEALQDVRVPGELTAAALEVLDTECGADVMIPAAAGTLRGTRVAGPGGVAGHVRVLRRSEEIDSFQRGEILVARFTDPTWTPVFPLASGIITEIGGWLSHAAILAREYDLTGIVGVIGAMDALRTGELVHLSADGTIERFGNRRIEDRVSVSVAISLRRVSETLPARLADLSPGGALLLVPGHKLEVGEDLEIRCDATQDPFGATVVRNGLAGVYGLRFRGLTDPTLATSLGIAPGGAIHAA